MNMTMTAQWREAVSFSLLFNLTLFILMAAVTERGRGSEQVEYVPVEMIQLEGETKQLQIRPSAPSPPVQQQTPEIKPEPVKEKELGMDKTGVEASQPPQQQQIVYQPFHKVSRMPYFKTQVKPVYPPSERAAGVEARVVMEIYINQYGGVDDVKIVKSAGTLFDQAVIKAVKASTFDPGYMEGRPVAVRVQIPYVFKLR